MRNLLRYVLKKTIYYQLPKLKTSLKTVYKPDELDEETIVVLMTGVVRDEAAVGKLFTEHDALTAAELVNKLPPRTNPDYGRRVRSWWQLVEGSQTENPDVLELREAKRRYYG